MLADAGGGGRGGASKHLRTCCWPQQLSTKWKNVVGLMVQGGGEGPDPVEHCNQAHPQRAGLAAEPLQSC